MSPPKRIPIPATPPPKFHFKYTIEQGFFTQSSDSTDDKNFNFKTQNFGLINRRYATDTSNTDTDTAQWPAFETYVRSLDEKAKQNESFKVLFLGRHGQGWHNVAEEKYGTAAWDRYWSALDGADGIVWADARLTPHGETQATDVQALWNEQLSRGIPAPETYYVSPFTRALETADLSFQTLDLPPDRAYAPVVKELLRETLGVHTCDRRSARRRLEKAFPHVVFEEGFAEEDELWEAEYREPRAARRYRLARLLDDVFANDEKVFVSLTAHSGAVASILEVVGHRDFALETGGVIPVFVKAERVDGEREVPPKESSDAPPMCKDPPE